MRVLIAVALLLGSSSLDPSFAQEPPKPPPEAPQTSVPARPDQNAEPSRDQRAGRDPSRVDNREMGPDWRLRRGDGEWTDRDRRETDSEGGAMTAAAARAPRIARCVPVRECSAGATLAGIPATTGIGDATSNAEIATATLDVAKKTPAVISTKIGRGAASRSASSTENGDEYCRYRR